jgi:hypothetical protein
MRKNIVGDWGANLNDADYACALAALGVLESTGTEQHRLGSDSSLLATALEKEFAAGERTPIWRRALNVINGRAALAIWRKTVHADAAALAAAWRHYRGAIGHPRRRPRLAVVTDWRARTDLFDFNALCGWLKQREVGLDALVIADSRVGETGVAWHWPLQIGVPAGAQSASTLADLRAAQGQHSWSEQLSRCFTVGAGRDASDLLILTPASLRQILDEPRTRIRATFVACLEDPPVNLATVCDRYGTLRDRVGAVGVAAIGRLDKTQRLADWFNDVLRDLSHDLPIHATVGWEERNSLVLGDPRALDRCRILAIAERQDRILAAMEPPPSVDLPLAIPGPESEPTFGGPASSTTPATPTAPPVHIQPRLADELRGRVFLSESIDGLRTAEDLARRASEIDEARPPRWIQAKAWRSDAPESAANRLAQAQWNLLAVHIGPTDVQRVDTPFPDAAVDFTRGDVAVTVQVELAGAHVTPLEARDVAPVLLPGEAALRPTDMRNHRTLAGQLLRGPLAQLAAGPASSVSSVVVGLASSTIVLPPAGDSTLALFGVCPLESVKQVIGRVAIIHNNRVLQTACLSVGIGGAAEQGEGIVVATEASIHPRDDDLAERRGYDVAIQMSDVGGKLHLAIQHDDIVTPVQLDDLGAPISAIRKALERAALRWDYTKPMLKQAVLADTLYALAGNGAALEQHLRNKCGDQIDRWERIHLVSSTNEFLPLEYVYDGPPPKVDAEVCPNIPGALERGSCASASQTPGSNAACPNQRDTNFVCPMHFWGFRRVIERNGTAHAAGPASAGGRRSSVPVPSKRAYGQVRAMLFGASNRAFAYATGPQAQSAERAALVKALGVFTGTMSDSADWEQWRQEVKKHPNLLVLLAHTDERRGTRVLEIGSEKFLGYQEILPDLSGAGGQPQLLILLGCSAADVGENFQPYPERFRDAGVSVVLAPVAPLRGADAVPIAKSLAERLAQRLAGLEPTAFGELLPLLRRELLLAGHPGVMGIVGFGDGDWLLGGQ